MSEHSEGGWTTRGERRVYDSPWVRVDHIDVTTPSGERIEDFHVVELSPIAVAMVVNDEDEVLLLWKYRFVTRQWGYELPGGMVDAGESAAASAARETAEESGWEVRGEPEHLLTIEPLPGQVRARSEVYLFRGARHVGGPTDPEESDTAPTWVPTSRIPELVGDQRILGSLTAVALLYYDAIARPGRRPRRR